MKKIRVVYIGVLLFIITIMGLMWYSFRIKTYYVQIPTKLSIASVPLIEVDIQDEKHFLKIDLGSKFQLTLNKRIINQLNKKNAGTLLSRDMHGNSYEAPAYLIPMIKIRDLSFKDVMVNEESDDFIVNTTFWTDPNRSKDSFENQIGAVGRGLLKNRHLLLDFYNSRIIISNDIKQLKRAGYHLKEFNKCLFEVGRTGAIVTVNTDIGKAKLSIDTGSTVSFIRTSFLSNDTSENKKYGLPIVTTSTFEIAGKDFGTMDLYLQNITPELSEIDGILGMDFLKTHVVYIDYQDKIVYVRDSRPL